MSANFEFVVHRDITPCLKISGSKDVAAGQGRSLNFIRSGVGPVREGFIKQKNISRSVSLSLQVIEKPLRFHKLIPLFTAAAP
jgi:hypothetical protein